ncbi:MAG: Hsp20/alpha crystallin family protein [Synergistaceae bacterium]|jgi:HSP20 family protein|nr:Hsp20/alpha crystallin family protein [Synergistaceae bacterium]
MFELSPFTHRRLAQATPLRVTREFDDLIDRLFWSGSADGARGLRDFDLYEKDGKLYLSIEVPGINPDELEIRTSRDRVSIKSAQKADEKGDQDEGRTWYSRKSTHSFNYEVTLPFEIDTEKAEATFENGMIHITAPRFQASESKVLSLKKA